MVDNCCLILARSGILNQNSNRELVVLYVILAVVVISAYLAISSLWEIIERLKVLEYEQNCQFNELKENIEMLSNDVKDINDKVFDVSCSVDEMKPPKARFDDY